MNAPDHRPALSREAVEQLLLAPFDPQEVKFKPAVVNGSRAMALCYVDARVVQDRLDDVFGVAGWQDEYEPLPDGSVVCKLKVRIDGEWITKTDVGGQSEQPDEGDRRKAAFSDALKRAAVKLGIGRYLYRLPQQWVDYDAQKKRFVSTPSLPAWALPGAKPVQAQPAKAQALPAPAAAPKSAAKLPDPATGPELLARLERFDAQLATAGKSRPGDVLWAVKREGRAAGHTKPVSEWEGDAVAFGVQAAKDVYQFIRDGKADDVAPPSEAELDRLTDALAAKGRKWTDVLQYLNAPKGFKPEDLTRVQWRVVMQKLQPEPAAASA